MSASQKLVIWTYPQNYRVWKAQIAGNYNEVEIETPEFAMGTQNKTPEFLAKFPMGKVPAMETPFGNLFESGAIARYVARLRADTGLLGSNFFQTAQIDQWIDWSAFELESARGAWLGPIWGYRPYVQSVYEESKKNVLNCFNVLNTHLKNKTYIVGNQVTLADIVIVTAISGLFATVITDKQREAVPEMMRWYNTCINQPQFKKVMGEPNWAKAEQVYEEKKGGETKAAPAADKQAPKAEESSGKKNKGKGGNKQESKKEEEKPAETPKEKEAEKPKEESSGKKNKGKGGNKQESKKEEDKPAPKAEEKPKEAEKPKSEETPKKGGNKGGNKQESGKKPAEERPKTAETPKETPKKAEEPKPKQESGKKEGGQSNKKKSKGKN